MNSNFIISCHAFKGSILTILSSDNLDWLDKCLPINEEGRERYVDSRRKGKVSRTISSSSSSDDGDNGGSRGWGLALVGAVEKLLSLVRVMLVKWILACHGHKEMKITMPHKIQIMDIDQGYGNSKSIWKG